MCGAESSCASRTDAADDACTDRRRRLRRPGCELLRLWTGHRHDEVEAIDQGARDLVAVGGDARRRAGAVEPRVAAPAARTEVHGRDEPEARREQRPSTDACDGDDAVLERLPERLEHRARELRKLVEQQDTAMGEAHLPRSRDRAAAHDRRRRGSVVRCAERRRVRRDLPQQRSVPATEWIRVTSSASSWRERRQDRRQATREHRLAGSRRAGEQEVVRSRGRDLERPPVRAPARGPRRGRAAPEKSRWSARRGVAGVISSCPSR